MEEDDMTVPKTNQNKEEEDSKEGEDKNKI